MHLLARLVFDIIAAFDHDLHLVVGVRVDERVAFFESVEAAADGGGGVEVLAGRGGGLAGGGGLKWAGEGGREMGGREGAYLENTSPRNALLLEMHGGLKVDCALE